MKILTRFVITLATGGILLMIWATDLQTQGSAQPQGISPALPEGVEVLTRGPIHEAFAQPESSQPAASPLTPKQPPEPVNELPPLQKPEGDQVQWIPGYWAWDEDRQDYLWVSGIWRSPPPDRQWVPGYWQQVDGGWRWISGYWGPRAETSVQLLPAPPEPVEAAIPPQPNADSIYSPGIWVYQENRYWWRAGHWIGSRPGWVWIPAHYCWTPGGFVFVRGYWDHDLDHRGLCFAPVYFDARVYGRPGWTYRPHFTLGTDFLLGSLFVHSGWNHYYFGDYYDSAYARRGYTPLVDYRGRGNVQDPLYSYYRWQHRAEPRWDSDLRAGYVARRENAAARPPRTFALQERGDAKLRVAAPLEQWKGTNFKLEPVTKTHVEEIHKNNQEWRSLSQERGKIETQIMPLVPAKVPNVAAPVKIELPKTTIQHPVIKNTPPHPELPKLVPNPPPHKLEEGKKK